VVALTQSLHKQQLKQGAKDMKSKFFTLMIAATLALTCILGAASAQNISTGGVKTLMPPDIEVMVEAFDAQGKSIKNGNYIGDDTGSSVRFTIKNNSNTPTGNFTYKMVATNGTTKIYDPPAAQLSLNAKEVKVFPMVKLSHALKHNDIAARILADIGNFVKESNESNNKAEINYKGAVAY
jgi:hypothetical protein